MSDNWNPPPGNEPADGEQPAGPPERGPGGGQPPKWWTGDTAAKREFQDPAQGERPPNKWFGEGWANRRPENPDEPSSWQTSPEQSRPTPPQAGPPQQPGPQPGRGSQPGPPQQSGPSPQSGRGPQPGPAQQSGRPQSGPQQAGPGRPGPGQSRPPQQPGTNQSQSSAWHSAPSQSNPEQPGPYSEGSYLWGSPQSAPQQSPWSNALPPQQPQQQRMPRHGASSGNQLGPMGQPVQQGPNWQYPPIPIPQPPGGRRRKPTRTPRLLLIGLVVLAVLVVGTGVTLLVRNTGSDAPQTTGTPSAPASESPSESPSESASSAPTPTRPPGPTVDEVVKASKLYSVGPIAASKCAEPLIAPVNFTAARNYYNRLLPCLNRTWSLAMKKGGLPFRAPKAVVYAGKLPSPCGIQRSVRAAYCGANQTIYLPFAVDLRYYQSNPMYARAIMLNTFAHEYGHHVQNLAGILGASVTRQQKMTPNQKLQESRRRELQATCLGAAYLGANAAFTPMRDPLLQNWKFLISHTGDDYARPRIHDHGNRVSNYQWSIAGYNNKKPDACNTFTAADVRVN